MNKKDERRIVRLALHDNLSAKKIEQVTKIDVTVRHIQRVLSGTENVSYIKRKISPSLTSKHKESRVEFAKKYALKKDIWTKVSFLMRKNLPKMIQMAIDFIDIICSMRRIQTFFARTQLTVRNTVTIWEQTYFHLQNH